MAQPGEATTIDAAVDTRVVLRSVRTPVASLSGGQRQAIAVAKAVMWNSRLVILDEPTAALGVAQTRNVLDLVRRLADKGLGVILISHNMRQVFDLADRIVVFRRGRIVANLTKKETSGEEVVAYITGAKQAKEEVVADAA